MTGAFCAARLLRRAWRAWRAVAAQRLEAELLQAVDAHRRATLLRRAWRRWRAARRRGARR
jgi:hypothetical protein